MYLLMLCLEKGEGEKKIKKEKEEGEINLEYGREECPCAKACGYVVVLLIQPCRA